MPRVRRTWSSFASRSGRGPAIATSCVLVLACSSRSPARGDGGPQATAGAPGAGAIGAAAGQAGAAAGAAVQCPGGGCGGRGGIDITPAPNAGAAGAVACAQESASPTLTRLPVDVIVVIDNSGSMGDEIDAVERNINVNFADALTASGIDYRVIMISRHERPGRETSICVERPLSGNPSCDPPPPRPVHSDKFFQYSLKVDSLNSLALVHETYDGSTPDEFDVASGGWSQWLRASARKVFLEFTDDNSEEMTWQDFEQALFTMAPEHFGSASARNYVFHSIIGIAEKPTPTDPWLPEEPVQTGECTGNDNKVENAGPVYQELSRVTGGLRFALCQYTAYDVVFRTIAENVVTKAEVACDFAIPPPPQGRMLDLEKVAVLFDPKDGSAPSTLGQARTRDACVPNAFYIDTAAQRIALCPEACAAVRRANVPQIDVLFTCEPTILPPPR